MNTQTVTNTVFNTIPEDELRAVAVKELGLEHVSSEDQDKIFKIVQETITLYVQTAILVALGADKVAALEAVPDGDDALFAKQLSALLPNLQQVVDDAVVRCIHDNRAAFDAAIPKRV